MTTQVMVFGWVAFAFGFAGAWLVAMLDGNHGRNFDGSQRWGSDGARIFTRALLAAGLAGAVVGIVATLWRVAQAVGR